MKKKKLSETPKTDLEKIQILLQNKFTMLEEQIEDLAHAQKISGQKNTNQYSDFRLRLIAENARLEKNLRAEIQVANQEQELRLVNKLEEMRKDLNSRITHVGDLITSQFGKKLVNHEKRIGKLETEQRTL